jgi:hypothetical protein
MLRNSSSFRRNFKNHEWDIILLIFFFFLILH